MLISLRMLCTLHRLFVFIVLCKCFPFDLREPLAAVEGGHRAILFNRLGGVQEKVYTEGINFRVPWFQWPIVYDCRTKPQKFGSPTGTKGASMRLVASLKRKKLVVVARRASHYDASHLISGHSRRLANGQYQASCAVSSAR